MNKKSKNILDALEQASDGKDVFAALSEVPTENLKHMRNMCDHIIDTRFAMRFETICASKIDVNHLQEMGGEPKCAVE